jgi:hypothetical protein
VEAGALDPDSIVTPVIYVDRSIQGQHYERRIERQLRRQSSGFPVLRSTT